MTVAVVDRSEDDVAGFLCAALGAIAVAGEMPDGDAPERRAAIQWTLLHAARGAVDHARALAGEDAEWASAIDDVDRDITAFAGTLPRLRFVLAPEGGFDA